MVRTTQRCAGPSPRRGAFHRRSAQRARALAFSLRCPRPEPLRPDLWRAVQLSSRALSPRGRHPQPSRGPVRLWDPQKTPSRGGRPTAEVPEHSSPRRLRKEAAAPRAAARHTTAAPTRPGNARSSLTDQGRTDSARCAADLTLLSSAATPAGNPHLGRRRRPSRRGRGSRQRGATRDRSTHRPLLGSRGNSRGPIRHPR